MKISITLCPTRVAQTDIYKEAGGMPNPVHDAKTIYAPEGEKGRHLWPRHVRIAAEGKPSHDRRLSRFCRTSDV